jgi:hypothetical protein
MRLGAIGPPTLSDFGWGESYFFTVNFAPTTISGLTVTPR